MGKRKAYKNAVSSYAPSVDTSAWLANLISSNLAPTYKSYSSGGGLSPSEAAQLEYEYKTFLEEQAFNREMQADQQSFNHQMQLESQAWQSSEAEKQRDWEEQMYVNYESIEGQVQQMAANGLNPALLYGGVNSGAVGSGASAGSAGMASSGLAASGASTGAIGSNLSINDTPGAALFTGIMDMLLGGVGSISSIYDTLKSGDLKQAQTAYYQQLQDNVTADTRNKRLEAQMREIDLQYADAFKQLGLTEAGVRMTNLDAQTQKYLSEVDLALSNVKVNEGRLKLLDSETALNYKNLEVADQKIVNMAVEAALNNGKLHQIQELLVWQKNQLRAAAAKDDAAAQEALSRSEYTDAQTQQVLEFLNLGGVEEQIKGMKSERRRAVANCIIGNICNVANSVAGFLPQKITSTTYTNPSTTRTEYYDGQGVNTGSVVTESTPSTSTTTRITQ